MPVEDERAADGDSLLEEGRFLQQTIVAHLAQHENARPALRWAQDALPFLFRHLFDHPEPAVNARASYWLVRDMWNAMPLPANGFHPKPLPEPQQEDPCPCGSGSLYATCCWPVRQTQERRPTPEQMWRIFVTCRSDAYWLQTEKAGELPTVGLVCAAVLYRESERWQPLRKLAEARLAAPRRCTDPDVAHVIDLVCDAYDVLHSTPRKKLAILRQFAAHETPELRCAANQRLATILLDAGDSDAAWAAAAAAREALPDSPGTALFELTMLAGAGELDRASERALYWRGRLAEAGDVSESLLRTLDAYAENPQRAFEDAVVEDLPASLLDLLAWIDEHADRRPLPQLRWRALKSADDDEALRGACQPVVGRKQRRLEEEWLAVSGMDKPFSTQPYSGAEDECWRHCAEWTGWLREHMPALDSVTILDDVAILLAAVEADLGGASNRWVTALLARGAAMVAKHWPPERDGRLPWLVDANRPALRLLASFIEQRLDDWEDSRLERAISLYLRLNPSDNHGFRAPFVNQLLAVGRDADALACAERYPKDMFAETRYGEVLALHRLGRLEDAESRLREATAHLPLVLKYLTRSHIRRPKLDEQHLKIGGQDQAWLYREEMRTVWAQTAALDWLRGFGQ